MPTFAYVARTRDGRTQRGTLEAENRQALMNSLRRQGMTADKVVERRGSASLGPSVKTKELMIFTRQLSTIVNAGLPLLQGLDILAEQTEDARFQKLIYQIGRDVEAGETFSEALKKYPRSFPILFVAMVRAGEASGNLDTVLLQLADYLEYMEDLKRRIRSAMMYPVVALGMILLIAAGLIIWVVPQFGEIFASFGAKLPAPTLALITISNMLRSFMLLLVIAAGFMIWFCVRLYGSTDQGRYTLDRLKLNLPVLGKLTRRLAISRFARTLSTLTRSGVAILGALEIVENTTGNQVYARAIRAAADSVRKGETLADPLARSGEFPAMVTRMIGVGEKTGALEEMLGKISDFYDSEVKAAIDGLTSLIEPILILLMGLIVGGIVIALFMPILTLPTLLQGH
jgi:type IV pilus assembly protein PilC